MQRNAPGALRLAAKGWSLTPRLLARRAVRSRVLAWAVSWLAQSARERGVRAPGGAGSTSGLTD